MAFDAERMPEKLSYGYVGGPGFATEVIETVAGHEERVQRWQEARWEWRVSKNLQTGAEVQALLTFFLARRGAARGFLFKDWGDYASTTDGKTTAGGGGADVDYKDQAIGVGDGVQTQFQLRKQYVSGNSNYVRSITWPIASTVKSGVNLVEKTKGVDFDIDDGNGGVVIYSVAPPDGEIVTAGFEFDVPVRFGVEIDAGFPARIEAYDVESVRDIPLIEIKDEVEQPENFSPGGTWNILATSTSHNLTLWQGRFVRVNPQTAGLSLYLPNPFYYPGGGPYFHVYNDNGTNSIEIRDHLQASVITLNPTSFVVIFLEDNLQGTKAWWAVET